MNRASMGFAPGRGMMITRTAYSPGELNLKSSL
jgi:hypothetical protein